MVEVDAIEVEDGFEPLRSVRSLKVANGRHALDLHHAKTHRWKSRGFLRGGGGAEQEE